MPHLIICAEPYKFQLPQLAPSADGESLNISLSHWVTETHVMSQIPPFALAPSDKPGPRLNHGFGPIIYISKGRTAYLHVAYLHIHFK